MNIVELERQIEVACERLATLEDRAARTADGHESAGLRDALGALHASLDELTATTAALRRQHDDLAARGDTEDLLQREAAARRAAEAAQGRLAFLAAASSVLNRALDHASTLTRVAHLALPLLGDWCVIDLLDDDGSVNRLDVAHTDPAAATLARALEVAPRSVNLMLSRESAAALGRGQSELVIAPTDEDFSRSFPDERMRGLLRATRPTSWMRVPLISRGTLRGIMLIIAAEHGRRYTVEDLSLAEDLASRMAVAIEQARLYQQAQDANQTKSSFLATMSHELRTPLNAIIGYSELLLLGVPDAIPAEAARQVGRIRGASRHLLSLIEEILSFSRIEAGSEQLFLDRLLPLDIARDAASLVEPLAHTKGLGFRVDVSSHLPVLETDSGKLRQILVNLLSNAVKFTPQGEVVLSAYEAEEQIRFVVRDTGVGIPHEHQERVFEAFWQVRYPAMYHAGGTGLGLSVSRQLARMLGGDLTVRSAAGAGSTFTLSLPAGRRGTHDGDAPRHAISRSQLRAPDDTRPTA